MNINFKKSLCFASLSLIFLSYQNCGGSSLRAVDTQFSVAGDENTSTLPSTDIDVTPNKSSLDSFKIYMTSYPYTHGHAVYPTSVELYTKQSGEIIGEQNYKNGLKGNCRKTFSFKYAEVKAYIEGAENAQIKTFYNNSGNVTYVSDLALYSFVRHHRSLNTHISQPVRVGITNLKDGDKYTDEVSFQELSKFFDMKQTSLVSNTCDETKSGDLGFDFKLLELFTTTVGRYAGPKSYKYTSNIIYEPATEHEGCGSIIELKTSLDGNSICTNYFVINQKLNKETYANIKSYSILKSRNNISVVDKTLYSAAFLKGAFDYVKYPVGADDLVIGEKYISEGLLRDMQTLIGQRPSGIVLKKSSCE